MRRGGWAGRFVGLGIVLASAGCNDDEVRRCHAEMASSQQALLEMDKTDLASVTETLKAIETTLGVCKAAKRQKEVADVQSAKQQVEAHLAELRERAERPPEDKLSEAELNKLVAEGDPTCPQGQGYEHGDSKKLIRCTGPRLVAMTRSQVEAYFERRGYKLRFDEKTSQLKAEYGATAYEFHFDGGTGPARCLSVTSAPGIPWQETVARLTAVAPSKLERDQPISLPGGAKPLRVEGESQFTVHLGECKPPANESAGP